MNSFNSIVGTIVLALAVVILFSGCARPNISVRLGLGPYAHIDINGSKPSETTGTKSLEGGSR